MSKERTSQACTARSSSKAEQRQWSVRVGCRRHAAHELCRAVYRHHVLRCWVSFPREFDPTWFRRECCRTPIEPEVLRIPSIPLQSSKCGELLPQWQIYIYICGTCTLAQAVRPFRPVVIVDAHSCRRVRCKIAGHAGKVTRKKTRTNMLRTNRQNHHLSLMAD